MVNAPRDETAAAGQWPEGDDRRAQVQCTSIIYRLSLARRYLPNVIHALTGRLDRGSAGYRDL
jgi:hypothetical protein